MRLLFCNYEYPPLGGGGGVVMAALARQLARKHEVTVLTSKGPGLAWRSDDAGVQVVRVPVFFRRELAVANFPSMFAYLPSGLLRGIQLGRRGAFDVVNTHFVVPTGPLGYALARWYRVPNVLSVHGGDLFDPSKRSSPHRHAPLRSAVRTLLRAADHVVAQSRDTARHVRELYGMDRDLALIPLGIERPPKTVEHSRAHLGIPEDAFLMITIGRMVARKAAPQLVEVLAHSAIERSHLVIVGDGPEIGNIERCATELGVRDRVHLLGMVDDREKFAALAAADIFVSTSQHEGFGLVFLEAMAFGLPIVCYDRGGQVDFLRHGETGFVLPLNDTRSFVDALRQLDQDVDARQRMGARNLEIVEQFFIDTCAARYEAIFEAVIARRAKAPGRAVSAS